MGSLGPMIEQMGSWSTFFLMQNPLSFWEHRAAFLVFFAQIICSEGPNMAQCSLTIITQQRITLLFVHADVRYVPCQRPSEHMEFFCMDYRTLLHDKLF